MGRRTVLPDGITLSLLTPYYTITLVPRVEREGSSQSFLHQPSRVRHPARE